MVSLSFSYLYIFSFNSFLFLAAMSSKFDLKKLFRKAKAKAIAKTLLPTRGKGIHIGERPPKKAKTALKSFSVQGKDASEGR